MPKITNKRSKTSLEKKKIIERFNRCTFNYFTKTNFCIGQNEYRKNIKFMKHIDYIPYSVESNNLPIYFNINQEIEDMYDSYQIELGVEHTINTKGDIKPDLSKYKKIEFHPSDGIKNKEISLEDKTLTIIKHNGKYLREFLKQNRLDQNNQCVSVKKYLNSIVYSIDRSIPSVHIPIHLGFFFKSKNICNEEDDHLNFLRIKARVTLKSENMIEEKSFDLFSDAIFLCKTKNDICMIEKIQNIVDFQKYSKMSYIFNKCPDMICLPCK